MPPEIDPNSPVSDQALWDAVALEKRDGTTPPPAVDDTAALLPPAQADGASAAPAPQQAPDPVQLRLEELAAANKLLANELSTVRGRVGKLQSALDRAEQHPQQQVQQPSQAQQNAALQSTAEFEQLKQEFPDWGRAIESMIQANRPQQFEQQAAPQLDVQELRASVMDSVRQELHSQALGRVETKFPGWRATVNTPTFQEWRMAQPAEVQALGASDFPEDAIEMLGRYQQHVNQAQSLTAHRQEVLQGAVQQRPSAVAAPSGSTGSVVLTEAQAWAVEAAARKARMAQN